MSSDTLAPPPITPEQRADDTRFCREILLELIAIGAEHARLAIRRDQARTEAATAALPPDETHAALDPAAEHERITRAVRRSILLLEHLGQGEAQPTAAARERARVPARRRILREIDDEIERDVPEPVATALRTELLERLDSPECDEEIDTRPLPDVILDLRRDLGIATVEGCDPYFKRRTPADVVELHATAAQPRAAASWADQAGRPTPILPPPKPEMDIGQLSTLALGLANTLSRAPPR